MSYSRYALLHRAPLDPRWFNTMRHGRHTAVVGADKVLELAGEQLTFVDPMQAPAPGTLVEVWLERNFVCVIVADLQAAKLAQDAAGATAALQRREHLNAARARAEAFNARIQLPVAWDVAQKDVLSGLSATSNGDGRNAASVEHIYLQAPLVAGRLKRSAGDLLCATTPTENGKRWSGVVERLSDGDGIRYAPRVTCKACLKLATRWIVSLEP